MGTTGVYKRGLSYPNEGFVQKAVEEYFLQLGFKQIDVKYSDFVCVNPNSGEKWVVEVKGATKAIGLDFHTCLGQLVQRMDSENCKYEIALPNITEYIYQCKILKQWVRNKLQSYWLLIDDEGQVKIYSPNDKL